MKKNSEILGLPVISITEGRELGQVKCLVISPLKGAVVAMVIEDDNWCTKLLPFAGIIGFGDNAITITNSTSIVPITDDNDILKLLNAKVKLIGAKVITQLGSFQGRVTEYSIDNSGIIVSCQIEGPNGEVVQIQGQSILTFGKEFMIISDDKISVSAETIDKVETFATDLQATPVSTIVLDQVTDSTQQLAVTKHNDDSVKRFEDKQRAYLQGKKATRRIETDNGIIIVEKGDEITNEIIQEAQDAGKFVELSMNI